MKLRAGNAVSQTEPAVTSLAILNNLLEDAMKAFLIAALLIPTIFVSLPAFAEQKEISDTALLSELTEHSKGWDDAFNSNTAEALAAKYTEDAVEVTNQGPIYGREAIQKHYAELLKKFKFSNHTGKVHKSYALSDDHNIVLSHGEYSFTASDDKGNSIPLQGYWSSVSVKENGVWRDKMQTWNVAQTSGATPGPEAVDTQP
jgi:uncharacterized protein (TIGR02246 family)